MGYMPGCKRRNCNNRYNACDRCITKLRRIENGVDDDEPSTPMAKSWETQSVDEDYRVKVDGDNCRDGRERTDFLIFDRKSGQRAHYSVDSDGDGSIDERHGFK